MISQSVEPTKLSFGFGRTNFLLDRTKFPVGAFSPFVQSTKELARQGFSGRFSRVDLSARK